MKEKEGSKNQQLEKLNCDTVSLDISADPVGFQKMC